jgi:hypothetical protein
MRSLSYGPSFPPPSYSPRHRKPGGRPAAGKDIVIRFATFNLYAYDHPDTEAQRQRRERVHRVLESLRDAAASACDGLVIAVQELIAPDPVADGDLSKPQLAGRRLVELAEAVGLRCRYAQGKPAVAVGGQRHHSGLLWNDLVEPGGGAAHDLWLAAVARAGDAAVRGRRGCPGAARLLPRALDRASTQG